MTCEACEQAEKTWPNGLYMANCISCQARMFSQSPQYFESYQRQDYTRGYLTMLETVFGKEWEEGHKQVRAWSKLILELKERNV